MSGYIGNIPTPQATQTRDTFTATSGQTSFATSGYTPNFLDVFLNGVHLVNGTDYTASNGSDVVLTTGATTGDNLEVVAYTTFQVVDQSFSGNFSVDSPTFVVDAANNRVGIGTSSPNNKAQVSYTSVAAVPSAGAGGHGFAVGDSGFGIAAGALTSGNGYLQATRWDGSATNYNLILQPNGGSVGIGTSTALSGPSAAKTLRVGNQIALSEYDDNSNPVQLNLNQNIDANENYIVTDHAARYQMRDGAHKWFSVASGTAGDATSIGSGEKMQLDASGNLMVGATSSNHKLYVVDPNNRAQAAAQFSVVGAGYSFFMHLDGAACYLGQNSDARAFRIYSGSNPAVGVNLAAGGTSWGTYSDERVKTALEPIEAALDKVSSLRAVTGRYLTDEETVSRSFLIAQDVQAVLPEAVDVGTDENKTLLLKYTEVMPLLVAAIKEQQAIIEALEARISALEGEPA
jgi:hypothetical protein